MVVFDILQFLEFFIVKLKIKQVRGKESGKFEIVFRGFFKNKVLVYRGK